MSQMEKEGFGEEFSICYAFCFGGIRGGQKTENTNSILSLVSFVIASDSSSPWSPSSAFASDISARATSAWMSRIGVFPRHCPPAGGWLGRHAVWGKEGILPPASVSSSQWFARVFSSLQRLRSFNAL